MGWFKQKFRNIKRLPSWLYAISELAVRLWYRTCKVNIVDPNGLIVDNDRVISVLWHNRLLFLPLIFPPELCRKTKAMISSSRDGQYVVDYAARFGIGAVRGSSKKRGAQAQHEAYRCLREGFNMVFTPDGPRGPKYRMSRGPIHLASISGRPIVPLAVNSSRYWQFKSWDNFQIPKLFCKIELVVGDPIFVPEHLSPAELEAKRREVEAAVMRITVDRDL